jgi:hypothetical protein
MRSLRVSSELFHSRTGWTPRRDRFDASWLAQHPTNTTVNH